MSVLELERVHLLVHENGVEPNKTQDVKEVWIETYFMDRPAAVTSNVPFRSEVSGHTPIALRHDDAGRQSIAKQVLVEIFVGTSKLLSEQPSRVRGPTGR
jgi:hypothetical protein